MGQVQNINNGLNGFYALANSLNATTDPTAPTSWAPIGDSTTAYTGTFNGLGNTISNLTISSSTIIYVGLFGQVGSGGMVENIGLVGGSVIGTAIGAYVGGLAGVNAGTIEDAYATGAVSGGISSYVGGLVGNNDRGTIEGAYATGAVTGGSGSAGGGLVGYNHNGTIEDAYATGAVTGGSGSAGGGLVGVNGGTIEDAYATGAVTGGSFVGGLVGYMVGGTITDGYWDTDTFSGAGVGFGSSTGAMGLATSGPGGLESGTVLAALNSLGTVWGNVNNQTTPYLLNLTSNPQTVFVSGAGTSPYSLLFTMGQVQNINNGLNNNYALANSLNATTDPTTPATWTPIGTNSSGSILNSGNGFNGTFDGLGNTIANLTINSAAPYNGLFGYSNGTVRDIGVTDASITGYSGTDGAVVADNAGTVANAYSTGAVFGTAFGGGLVGFNEVTGVIVNSYSTAGINVIEIAGGLVGFNSGRIVDTYATGAVRGNSPDMGGLVGSNAGTIVNAFATGSVAAGTPPPNYVDGTAPYYAGGLVGNNVAGTIINGYYDSDTTGQSHGLQSDGSIGYHTAELQSVNVSAVFSDPVWGIVPHVSYPYLTSFFPAPPQVISGIAYSDTGVKPLASNSNSTQNVSALVNGAGLGAVTTGANGYYYFLEPSGTISGSGSNVLVYAQSANAATLTVATGSVSLPIWGNTLIAPTPELTYSAAVAKLAADDGSLIANAEGSDANAQAVVNALTNPPPFTYPYGFIATGSSFTVDQWPTTGLYAQTTQTGAGLTVTASQILTGGLSLLSAGALTINAPISISGQSNVTLTVDRLVDLSFATGAHIDFGATNNNSMLSINGTPYTLLYDMGNDATGVANINNGLNGNYALATSLDASSVTGWIPLGTDGAGNPQNNFFGFAGVFTGLGNTISNLTVNIGSNDYAGLFGFSTGSIQNIGLVGVSVGGSGSIVGGLVGSNGGTVANAYATGTVSISGGAFGIGGLVGINAATVTGTSATDAVAGTGTAIGGLVGQNFTTGTITNSHATGAVSNSGNSAGAYVGGLVGENLGSITNVYATGSVSGVGLQIGGLVGSNDGSTALISNAYATGAVSVVGSNIGDVGGFAGENSGTIELSYATGAVSATGNGNIGFGGLVGVNSGTIANVYAMGAVSALGTGNGAIGGLVGLNFGGSVATITNAYATGAVTSSSAASPPLGGLVGYDNPGGTVTNGYYDANTTGQPLGVQQLNGATAAGLTTASLQAALPTGFSNPVWGIVAGVSYPYLTAFYPTPPQVISGIAYKDAGVTPLASSSAGAAVVSALVNGTNIGSVTTGVNGYYYFLEPTGTIQGGGSPVIAYTNQKSHHGRRGRHLFPGDRDRFARQFRHSRRLAVGAGKHDFAHHVVRGPDHRDQRQRVRADPGVEREHADQEIDFGVGGFNVDQALTVAGILMLSGTGAITQSQIITASELAIATPASVDLTDFNMVGTLAADVTGSGNSFDFSNAQDLTVGTVGALSGVTTNGGAITLTSFGDLQLNQPINANNGLAMLGVSPGGVFLSADGDISQSATGSSSAVSYPRTRAATLR